VVAILTVFFESGMKSISLDEALRKKLGDGGYDILAVIFFAALGFILYKVALSKKKA